MRIHKNVISLNNVDLIFSKFVWIFKLRQSAKMKLFFKNQYQGFVFYFRGSYLSATVHLGRAALSFSKSVAPPAILTSLLFCSCAWSIPKLENGFPLLLIINFPWQNSLCTPGCLDCNGLRSCMKIGSNEHNWYVPLRTSKEQSFLNSLWTWES